MQGSQKIVLKKIIITSPIQQRMCDGNPDVDAIFRLTRENKFYSFKKKNPTSGPPEVKKTAGPIADRAAPGMYNTRLVLRHARGTRKVLLRSRQSRERGSTLQVPGTITQERLLFVARE